MRGLRKDLESYIKPYPTTQPGRRRTVDKKCNQCDSQKVEYVCIDFEFDDKQISAYYCKECAEEYNYICPWCRHGLVELDKEGE